MSNVKLDYENVKQYIKDEELNKYEIKTKLAMSELKQRNDFTGFIDLPNKIDKKEFENIKTYAKEIKEKAQVLVVIGIGGSYLGAKAGIDFLSSYFPNKNNIEVIFAGFNLSGTYLKELVAYLEKKDFYINIISKSGGTLEPAVSFRILKELLEKKYGEKEANKRIIATTDKQKGILKEMSKEKGYRTLVVPDDIGGRYSVLTAVGLLPLATSGANIDELIQGANDERKKIWSEKFEENSCAKYAAIRQILYLKGKEIEVMSSFEPNLRFFGEWWKQLFGESECKNGRGLFPASLNLSSDLHSLGQLMQEGRRNIFETFLVLKKGNKDIKINKDKENKDKLNYLENKSVNYLNQVVHSATKKAHSSGLVPNLTLTIEKENSYNLGILFYFFEMACALSATHLGVNPFDQPGVEEYKKNIKEMLRR
ncbi:MAG: glucose-6-phosphate isomerase [Eubacteriales bacterium]|nr:glucose-6-phosphate isomerase [Eubacteriales bacterium]